MKYQSNIRSIPKNENTEDNNQSQQQQNSNRNSKQSMKDSYRKVGIRQKGGIAFDMNEIETNQNETTNNQTEIIIKLDIMHQESIKQSKQNQINKENIMKQKEETERISQIIQRMSSAFKEQQKKLEQVSTGLIENNRNQTNLKEECDQINKQIETNKGPIEKCMELIPQLGELCNQTMKNQSTIYNEQQQMMNNMKLFYEEMVKQNDRIKTEENKITINETNIQKQKSETDSINKTIPELENTLKEIQNKQNILVTGLEKEANEREKTNSQIVDSQNSLKANETTIGQHKQEQNTIKTKIKNIYIN